MEAVTKGGIMDLQKLAELHDNIVDLHSADPGTGCDLAVGNDDKTSLWFNRYSVEAVQVDPFIPDRVPDVATELCRWWTLDNGVILGRSGGADDDPNNCIGFIIPPAADDPPPIKGFKRLGSESNVVQI